MPQYPEDDDDAADQPLAARTTSRQALGQHALAQSLTRKARALISRGSSVLVIEVPHADWVGLIGEAMTKIAKKSVVKVADERETTKRGSHRIGASALQHLQQGRCVVYVSHEPDEILDEAVLAAVDARISVRPPTLPLMRKVISAVCGGRARGLTPGMLDLPVPAVLSAIRPGLSARACVENLARAIPRPAAIAPAASVPLLTTLPLPAELRSWSNAMLADLAAVTSGHLSSDHLAFCVLEGPPGCGKTVLAESLAEAAGWTLVKSSVGEWFTGSDGALGGVARSVAAFIDEILASEPAVGFLDELDGLPSRVTMDNRGRDFWTPVINLCLTEIDRLRKSGKKALLVGATNFYDRLDPALVRPGRMQQRVRVLPPKTIDEVLAVLRHYLRGDLADVDFTSIARVGLGATPAEIEGWVKQARAVARAAARSLELADILAQVVPEDRRNAADVMAIARHEAGHAIAALRLGHAVEAVTILPSEGAAGAVRSIAPTLVQRIGDIHDRVTIMLAGRAADILFNGGPNSGAEGDLEMATRLLLAARERQGLSGDLLFLPAIGAKPTPAVIQAVNGDLAHLLDRATALLAADQDLVLLVADRLVDEKVLSGDQLSAMLDGRGTKQTKLKHAATQPTEPGILL